MQSHAVAYNSTFKTQNTPRIRYIVYVRGTQIIYRFDYIWFRSAHITILLRRHVDVVMALPNRGYLTLILYFFVFCSPSTFHPRLFTLDFLPSTFYPRLLTLDFLPSTFYPHPRHFTLTLDFLPSHSTFNPRHSTNR
jgi:hypothetical protein